MNTYIRKQIYIYVMSICVFMVYVNLKKAESFIWKTLLDGEIMNLNFYAKLSAGRIGTAVTKH